MKKRGLGRGLSALLDPGSVHPENSESAPVEQSAAMMISPDEIEVNRNQPRKLFDDEALEQLTASVKERGILQPLIVRKSPDDNSRLELIAGERRLRAARQAGLKQVPVIVWEAGEEESLELALIENVQRENLNPLEEAAAYSRLQSIFGLTQEEISQKVGKRRSTVANALRLLELKSDEKKLLLAGEISAGHARALLSVADPVRRSELCKRIVSAGLSVRQTEELVKQQTKKKPVLNASASSLSPEMHGVQEALREAFGTKVMLQPKHGKGGREKPAGKIIIEYYTDDDIDRILEIIGASLD